MTKQEIKELREQLGLSQRQFAKQLGVSKRTVAYWESGKRRPDKNAQSKLALLHEQVNRESVNRESVNSDEQGNSKSVNSGEQVKNESVNSGEQAGGEQASGEQAGGEQASGEQAGGEQVNLSSQGKRSDGKRKNAEAQQRAAEGVVHASHTGGTFNRNRKIPKSFFSLASFKSSSFALCCGRVWCAFAFVTS